MSTTRPLVSYTGKPRKKTGPLEYQGRVTDLGTVLWQYRQEQGDDVYKREYRSLRGDFEQDMRDKFGAVFARKVAQELQTTGTVRVRL